MEWRKENRINEITKEDFSYFQKKVTVFFSGYDNEGRPGKKTVLDLLFYNLKASLYVFQSTYLQSVFLTHKK